MAGQKQLKEDIATSKNFNLLTRSYQEHAIGQINFARFSVLSSREFAGDLEEIFSNVKTSYKTRVLRKEIKNIVKKNGKDVWVLISANNKLYGDLIMKVCKLFAERIKNTTPEKVDLIIIGRQGKNIIDGMRLNRTYQYFELPDINVSVEYLKEICKNFILYENVKVFYGKFNNVVSQSPIETSISGDLDSEEQKIVNEKLENKDKEMIKKLNYLFEPSLEEILVFFENQILSLLLNQTVQEGQLARFASRINAMETAQKNIHKQLDLLYKKQKMQRNMQENKNQQELLAGRALWTRK
jgi:ATP synthase F1 gamma subunit